ncbi:MAG: hypothetical protein V2J12_05575 [Gammaproteobacteria bacterium]|jgi:hypothetical protein|nr:hypothetical protein [Gammaproteobacteria bacterium]
MHEPRYTPALTALFARPALPLRGSIRVRRGDPARGAEVLWAADAVAGVWRNVGFRAWGCPHIIAVCHGLAERLEGTTVEAAPTALDGWLLHLGKELDIPAEKAVKILIIKDTLLELFASAGCDGPGAATTGSG